MCDSCKSFSDNKIKYLLLLLASHEHKETKIFRRVKTTKMVTSNFLIYTT